MTSPDVTGSGMPGSGLTGSGVARLACVCLGVTLGAVVYERRVLSRPEVVMHERHVVISDGKRSWRKRASWWIWCTIGPQIHHEARINHVIFSEKRINIRVIAVSEIL